MPSSANDSNDSQTLPVMPDLRQSICHTLLAAAFILVGVLNPFAGQGVQASFHAWMMVALLLVVALSWYFLFRAWNRWRNASDKVRAIQVLKVNRKRGRARSHALMSALSILLASFAFLGRATVPEGEATLLDEALFVTGALIVIGGTAVLAQSLRNLIAIHRDSNIKN